MITYPFLTTLAIAALMLVVPTTADEDATSMSLDKKKSPVFPSACVKMGVYDNTKCEGHPQRVLMYPTWKKSGDSPCFHDPQFPFASVKDQYCDFEGDGTYHLSLYPLSGECATTPYTDKFAPVKVAVPTKTCYLGFKIEHCKKGPCVPGEDEEDNVELGDESSVAEILEQYLRENKDIAHLTDSSAYGSSVTEVLEKYLRGGEDALDANNAD